jgi:hypothetical protein
MLLKKYKVGVRSNLGIITFKRFIENKVSLDACRICINHLYSRTCIFRGNGCSKFDTENFIYIPQYVN